jgi:hypothetical protein
MMILLERETCLFPELRFRARRGKVTCLDTQGKSYDIHIL